MLLIGFQFLTPVEAEAGGTSSGASPWTGIAGEGGGGGTHGHQCAPSVEARGGRDRQGLLAETVNATGRGGGRSRADNREGMLGSII